MRTLILAALLALPTAVAAQHAPAAEWPAGWRARLDRPDADSAALKAVTMPPGWHITTGPSAILFDPGRVASGDYRVEAEIFLFNPGERREGFGVLIGGRDLTGPDQAYTYFLIRRDGRFLVKRRLGAETRTVRDWTESPAIVPWTEGKGPNVRNVLAVDVQPQTVLFLVNGQEVARVARSEVDTDGVVGLRVNHALDLHVSRLEVK